MSVVADGTVDELLRLAAAPDLPGAVELVERLRRSGVPVDRLLAELVVPVQQRVGELWETNAWTVAQEHATTAVIDAVVGQLLHGAALRPAERGPVAVVCAEGEWHALPARVVATGLRDRGWDVVFLGGSVPSSHLARAAADAGWLAAVVSCSVPMFLPGALRSIAGLHDEGVPVLAAGGGFGPDRLRADRLGADGWAPDLASGDTVLAAWYRSPPERLTAASPEPEAFGLEAEVGEYVEQALHELRARWPAMEVYDQQQLDRTREDLEYLLRFITAAVLTDDQRILADYLRWLRRVLASRGVPREVVAVTFRTVQVVLPSGLRHAHDLLLAVAAELFPA